MVTFLMLSQFSAYPAWTPDANLQPHEVHICLINLHVSTDTLQKLVNYLSPEERAKAAKFHFAQHREQFTITHAVLRLLLAHYSQLTPATVSFVTNPYGKPALSILANQSPLYFNLSHTQGLAICAFTHICELGIDIEYMRTNLDYEQIAAYVFSPQEQAVLSRLTDQSQAHAFFNAWTRKEAYIKARGKGLSLPLDLFDVTLHPDEPSALLETREADQDASAWSMYDLAVPSGYKAALALPAHNVSLRFWSWSENQNKCK
jgi:4'-phosphopantetheinyl transferase